MADQEYKIKNKKEEEEEEEEINPITSVDTMSRIAQVKKTRLD